MKQFLFSCFIFLVILTGNSFGQNLDNPGAYMTAISNAQLDMNKKYMEYMSMAAHSSRKRKIEKLRQQVIESIDNSRFKTIDLPIYKGDNSLRQSSIDYIKLVYNVFNEDYAKIVNMEEIAEQSFDEMQAFILLQEKTDEKLTEAAAKMSAASKAFAAKYNVQIIEGKDELGEKLNESGKVTEYKNKVYLVFFKCYWQDGEIIKAMNAGNLTKVEQGRTSLIRYVDEGMAALDTLKNFKGDPSLANTCKQVLQFYKKMAETELPKLTDYFLKQENFDKMKKSFEKKSDHTKEEVNNYNDAVNDLNKAAASYNTTNNNINSSRKTVIDNWNDAQKSFADDHTPHYKS